MARFEVEPVTDDNGRVTHYVIRDAENLAYVEVRGVVKTWTDGRVAKGYANALNEDSK